VNVHYKFPQPGGKPSDGLRHGRVHRDFHSILRHVCAFLFLLCCTNTSWAMPLDEYHKHVQQAIGALATLTQFDESETEAQRATRTGETLRAIRTVVPESADVEWNETSFHVENLWLHRELGRYENAANADRAGLLARITERLQAIEERLAEIEKPDSAATASKAESSKKLAEILRRPEYAKSINEGSALSRLWTRFWKWIESLFPKPVTLAPGRASLFSKVAQLLVILLALAVLAYVGKMFAPRLLRKRKSKKKAKPEPRIVLGERLEPDQSAMDLLTEAESLARRGELRAAIRKAYIALLLELGERKIIRLAQYKTNRDYLRAVREFEPLYENVKQLTNSFERHWYGFASATEDDWVAFRVGYKQALLK
jgi:hypothetical protein